MSSSDCLSSTIQSSSLRPSAILNHNNICVTGGCGFIGSELVNQLSADRTVVVIDKLSYCSRKSNLIHPENVIHYQVDVSNKEAVLEILINHDITTILHLAASSHVDASFLNVDEFLENNVIGTTRLLEACRRQGKIKLFLHMSTDEVYGQSLDHELKKTEQSLLAGSNPYAATKIAAEAMVQSYYRSYRLPIIIVRGNNVYGHGQYPEKLIPKFIMQLFLNIPLTIHGQGSAKRTFVHVSDMARGIITVMNKGTIGEIYNIGSEDEFSVMEIAGLLSKKMGGSAEMIHVADRTFNDYRYFIDSSKIATLGWQQSITFEEGIVKTIEWYHARTAEFKNYM